LEQVIMSIEIKEHAFNTDVVILNFAEGPPSGPPMALLHGGSARWQSFEPIIPDLATSWHLFAPDLRGHGKSGRAPGRYRLQDYADDVNALLEQQVSEPAILFGHSLGGMIALLVAAQHPDYVRAVIVGDSPLTSETWAVVTNNHRDRIAAWRDLAGGRFSTGELTERLKDTPAEVPGKPGTRPMREVMGEDSGFFPWLATNLYHNDPDMLTAILDDFEATAAGYEMEEVLPAIQCPVLLLQADPEFGGVMTNTEVKQALPLLAKPKHIRLKETSHALFMEQKEMVLQAVMNFLDSEVS
jgi:pimeloyl-ACP methyl ester carboxylesterase